MAILLAAAAGAGPAGQGQAAPPGAATQEKDVEAQLLADLELLQMLDMLRDLDTLRQMDEVLGPARAERKPAQGGRGKAQ